MNHDPNNRKCPQNINKDSTNPMANISCWCSDKSISSKVEPMPLPLQVIQENIKEFDSEVSVDTEMGGKFSNHKWIKDWHKTSLIALIDALIEEEKEKEGFTRNTNYYLGVQRKLKHNIFAHDIEPEVSTQILLEAETYLKQDTIGRLSALKEEIKKL